MLPSIQMTKVQNKVQEILANPDYDLDSHGLDVSWLTEVAIDEQMPKHYNEADENNLRLELRSRLEDLYVELTKLNKQDLK